MLNKTFVYLFNKCAYETLIMQQLSKHLATTEKYIFTCNPESECCLQYNKIYSEQYLSKKKNLDNLASTSI